MRGLYLARDPFSVASLSQGFLAFTASSRAQFVGSFLTRTQVLSGVFFSRAAFGNEQFFSNSALQAAILPGGIFIRNLSLLARASLLAFGFVGLALLYARYVHHAREKKYLLLLLLASSFQFIATVAFIPPDRFYVRYLTPLFGIATICIAEFLFSFFPEKPRLRHVALYIIVFCAVIASQNPSDRVRAAFNNLALDPAGFFRFTYISPPFAEAIKNEVIAIKAREERQNFRFFDIRSYRYYQLGYGYAAFWVPLERGLGEPLVEVDDANYRHFRPIGSPDYIFFDCEFAKDATKECITPFLSEFPQYQVTKEFSTDPPIYLAQKQAP